MKQPELAVADKNCSSWSMRPRRRRLSRAGIADALLAPAAKHPLTCASALPQARLAIGFVRTDAPYA